MVDRTTKSCHLKTIFLCLLRSPDLWRPTLLLLLLWVGGVRLPSSGIRAQTGTADSLKNLLDSALSDSQRVEYLLALSKELEHADTRKALDYAYRALTLARARENTKLVLRANMEMGAVLFYSGVVDAAARYYDQARRQALALDDKPMLLAIRFNLISIRLINPDNNDGIKQELLDLLRLAEDIVGTSGDTSLVFRFMPGIYNNLGMVCQAEGDFASAEQYLRKGLAVARRHPSAEKYRLQLQNVYSMLLFEMGKTEAALATAEVARVDSRRAGYDAMEAASLFHMAAWKEALQDTAAALGYMVEAYDLARRAGQLALTSRLASRMSEIYESSGNQELALQYGRRAQEFNQQYALERADAVLEKNDLLEKLARLEASRLTEQSQFKRRNGLLLGMLLLTVASGALAWFLLQRRNRLARLDRMNLELETDRLALRTELLQSELEKRDKQLASEALRRLQNNEMVRETVQQLLAVHRVANREVRESVLRAVRGLEGTLDQQVWEAFELRFEQVHQGFFDRLQAAFPNLTPNERRLCAFLKLNLTTKEIAAITTQSINSIYVARTRLRRKLGLQEEEDPALVSFIAGL